MEKITLKRLLPDVFRGAENDPPVSRSQVWLHNLELSRGDEYLIAAESGTGKTSLCSFIYGVRTDYQGDILFDGLIGDLDSCLFFEDESIPECFQR